MSIEIIHGLPMAEYRAWPEIGQSTLKAGRASMAHLRAALDGDRVIEETDAMRVGSAIHCAFLEPAEYAERVAVWDRRASTGRAAPRNGRVWDAFQAAHEGAIILTSNDAKIVTGAVAALRAHPAVARIISCAECGPVDGVEVSMRGEVQIGDAPPIRMKARPDVLTEHAVIDVKKTRSGDPRRFTAQAIDLGYHIQAAVYMAITGRPRFLFATVEDAPPYDVVVYEPSPSMIEAGRREAADLITRYTECIASGVWHGRANTIQPLDLPDWAAAPVTLDFGGESVEID